MYFISDSGIDLIKSHEGLRLTSYYPTPNDVLTIGYGHTETARQGMTIHEFEAEALLRDDIQWVEAAVNVYVKVKLTQNQYDALCSFVYNLGATNFRRSTLLKKLNNSDYNGASKEFKRWNKQKGAVLRGLTVRRVAEATLFSKDPSATLKTALMGLFKRKGD